MAFRDWRRYYFPVIEAGVCDKPFLYREDVKRFAAHMGLKLVAIAGVKCRKVENQRALWQRAHDNYNELYK